MGEAQVLEEVVGAGLVIWIWALVTTALSLGLGGLFGWRCFKFGFRHGQAYELRKLPKYIRLIDPNAPRKVPWYWRLKTSPLAKEYLTSDEIQ